MEFNRDDIEMTNEEMQEFKDFCIRDVYKKLTKASELSEEYFTNGMDILRLVDSATDDAEFWEEDELVRLCWDVRANCMMKYATNRDKCEYIYHDLFDKYAEDLLKDYLVKVISDPYIDQKNQPDSWVTIGGEFAPVEVKLHNFNSSALNQLKRYMRVFKCSRGIAVGEKYTAGELPSNIIFVKNKDLKEAYMRDKSQERGDGENCGAK